MAAKGTGAKAADKGLAGKTGKAGGAGKFYITTAIDYPNSKPHLGHAYEKTVADCLARWHRLKGDEVFFLTGTDEHGRKIQQAAEKAGKKPKEFVDAQVIDFTQLCEKWGISYDRFIRTTDADHEKASQGIFKRVLDRGDIYLGNYEGMYCTACEAFYLEKDLVGGLCPVHKKVVETLMEPSYFFRMSRYQGQLLDFYERNPGFISPERRKQEIVNRVREGLKDLSVSRTTFDWGIQLPNDPKHVIYVWFDALINYLSGIDYPGEKFRKFWPADVHLVGKDILWFHSVIWPTMLFSAGIEPPRKIFVHGFINTALGEKLSKTSGTVIDPIDLSEKYGPDTVRYFLLREIPLGEDGNFSIDALVERHNQELANDLGNLVNRVMSLSESKLKGAVKKQKSELSAKVDLWAIDHFMENFGPNYALEETFRFISACNKYVNDKKPWTLEGKDLETTLYSLLDAIRLIAILIRSFMPSTADKIFKQLNLDSKDMKLIVPAENENSTHGYAEKNFNLLKDGHKLGRKEILFRKIEAK